MADGKYRHLNLYLAIGTAECSANNLMKSEAQGNLFAIVNKKIKR